MILITNQWQGCINSCNLNLPDSEMLVELKELGLMSMSLHENVPKSRGDGNGKTLRIGISGELEWLLHVSGVVGDGERLTGYVMISGVEILFGFVCGASEVFSLICEVTVLGCIACGGSEIFSIAPVGSFNPAFFVACFCLGFPIGLLRFSFPAITAVGKT